MRKLLCGLLFAVTAPSGAQISPGPSLTLDEALRLARQNNPVYLQAISGRRRAETALRSAYGVLLPSASTTFGSAYRQGKPQFFQGVAFGANSDVLSSSWGLNFSYTINPGAVAALRTEQALLEAAEYDLTGAEQSLKAAVTQQYILTLQLVARAALQDTLVISNQLQLDLARAKAGVGSATSLDVKRGEVAVGQQQVAALRAHNAADVAVLQLIQLIGVPMPPPIQLTSTFVISEPTFDVSQLLDMAKNGNPALRALQSRETSAWATYRGARSQYVPSLSLNANFGGSTQKFKDGEYLVNQGLTQTRGARSDCFTTDSLRRGAGLPSIAGKCNAIQFTDTQASALRASNDAFPFRFTSNPYNFSLTLSLPLFDGFVREQRIQDAATSRSDARYNIRAQQLKLTADVTAAYMTLVADYRAVKQQEINVQSAREALQLAQERYRVGLNSLVDLQAARSDYETAEAGRIDAVFEYHRAYSALESAVGRALR
ncbi:MAG TPA: TolC family protein [Gemmatimonadaceae bacterium]|nr:TolC family protein [Gemmatimonadaceae bacterium]